MSDQEFFLSPELIEELGIEPGDEFRLPWDDATLWRLTGARRHGDTLAINVPKGQERRT